MKKLRIIIASAAIVAAAMTGYNALQKSTTDDVLLKKNIEALSKDETPEAQCGTYTPMRCYTECGNCGLEWDAHAPGPMSASRGNCSCGHPL